MLENPVLTTTASEARPRTLPTPIIVGVCAAEILSLASYSIVPALLPQIMDAWSPSSTQGGWLAGINAGGYMLGVVPLVARDRSDAAAHRLSNMRCT